MQPPSPNKITLGFGYQPGYPLNGGKHIGVDYASGPDPYAYAPEAGKIVFYGDAGTCGNNLQIEGKTGRVGFCHLSEAYVKLGDQVKAGQKLAKIGYTGYVQPPGPSGAHLHTVLKVGNEYVDIRKFITKPFGGTMANLSPHYIGRVILGMWGRSATQAEIDAYSKVDEATMLKRIIDDSQSDKNFGLVAALKSGRAAKIIEQIKQLVNS